MSREILEDLNPEQIAAVTHGKGPLLIIAGAGTGKTTVITRRIAWLIAEKLAKPGEILALTFTDKAANEMEARVDLLVPYGYVDVSISTFHAFGDRVLRDYALDLGLRPDYQILSLADQVIFFREHLFEFPLKYFKSLGEPTKHIEALLEVISRAKDEDITAEEYLKWAKKMLKSLKKYKKEEKVLKAEEIEKHLEIAKVYEKYQRLKMEKGFVDFGDQVSLTLKLLREHPSILKEFREKYKFILVDEFQDTNFAQFQLLKLLAGKPQNITVVADDDQAIYRFRGAAINNVLNFEKHFKLHKKIVLTKNYRSTQLILDAARRLISFNNPERLEVKAGINKELISVFGETGKSVEHRHFDRVDSEADWVARTIKEKFEKGEYKLKDFAILVRSNADAEPFRRSLNMLGIPHQFSGGGGLYSLPEVKFLISFLRVIGDLSDSPSLYSLALSEIYRIDPLDLQKINTFAKRRNYTLHYVFSHLENCRIKDSEFSVLSDIKEESLTAAKKLMLDINYYLKIARDKTTGEVLYQFLKNSGYLEKLTKEQSFENEIRLRNIARFFEEVRRFKQIGEADRVSEFVKYLDVLKEAGEDPESAQPDFDVDAVNILTVHKAKGLEFPVVFLVCLVTERFPVRQRRRPVELPEELMKEELPGRDFHIMEERRLFYVGMTRAKKELFLTSAIDYGGKRDRKVSQFVLEALGLSQTDIFVHKKEPIAQIELFAPREEIFPTPLPRDQEIISLSHYQIDDYLTCPLKYKYVHILRVPLLPNHQIIYGLALHEAVQAYFVAKKDRRKFTLKNLLHTFKNHWSSEGFISREHEEQRFAAGKRALERFFEEEKKRGRWPKFVEEDFTILEDKIQIKGRWDLVEESKIKNRADAKGFGRRRQKSKTIIVDFKSSEVRTQEEANKRVKESLQLQIYALAWKKMFGDLPDALELYFLETGIVGLVKPRMEDLEKTWEKIKEVAQGIKSEDFRAKPSYTACRYCSYSGICPATII